MNVSQLEADLAGFETIDTFLEQHIEKFDQAVIEFDKIQKFGLTKTNFAVLQGLYPELKLPEFDLGIHPVQVGSDKVGNEALAALGGGATTALLAALAAVLGWVIGKIFKGGISSGSGGGSGLGSSSGSPAKLKEAKIPFDVATIIKFYEQKSKFGTDKDKNSAAKIAGEARAAGYVTETVGNGKITANIKSLEDLVKDIVDLLSAENSDVEIVKVIGQQLPALLNPIVANLPYLSDKQKTNGRIQRIDAIDTLGTTRKAEKAKLTSALSVNYSSLSYATKTSVEVNVNHYQSVQKTIEGFEKSLEEMQKQVSGGKSNKKLAGNESAAFQGLGVLLVYVKQDLVPRMALTKKMLDGYVKVIAKTTANVLDLYTALPDADKEKMQKATGYSDSEIKDITKKSKEGDLTIFEKGVEVAEALEKNIKLTGEAERKLREALILKDII